MNKVLLGLSVFVGLCYGWKFGLAFFGAMFFLTLFLGLLAEMRFMFKYRREYEACANAVLANNEQAVDEVNRWTTHYYVHKSFRMSASKGKIDCGYRYSIRDRPRDPWGGGGGGDIGFVSFGV